MIEKPAMLITASVPSSTTGTAMAGISVGRQPCRKMKMTRMTSRIAIASVITTSWTDSLMKSVLSEGKA